MNTTLNSLVIKILVLLFVLIAIGTTEKKKVIVKDLFKAINYRYSQLLNSAGKLIKVLIIIMILLYILQLILLAFQICCLNDGKGITAENIMITILVSALSFLLVYFIFGISFVVLMNSVDIIENIKNNNISSKMMVSMLLCIILLLFSLLSENVMKENAVFLFLGSATCYILNIYIMLKIVRNPFCLVADSEQQRSKNGRVIILSSILIVLMIVADLYLFVLWAYFSKDKAYMCTLGNETITKWKLFYYTIISFSTIGYGDISPIVFESQAVAVLIAITNIICLIIFVSSILSDKNEFLSRDEK